MAGPFSLEEIARIRDAASRLAGQAAQQQGQMSELLATAEVNLERIRTAYAEHLASTADRDDALSHALYTQMLRDAAEVDAARRLCISAREHRLAAGRLVGDLGSQRFQFAADRSLGLAVLVVDDFQDSREWLSLVLENAGFLVRTAANGLEAVIAAYELQPAVIVMDLMMPVLDGVEAARLIKALDDLRGTRVIAYTAHAAPPTASGVFTAVLPKPSPPELVVETVRHWAVAS